MEVAYMTRKDIQKCFFTLNFVGRPNWFPEALLPITNSMEHFITSSLRTDLNTMKQTPNWTKAIFTEGFFKWPVKTAIFSIPTQVMQYYKTQSHLRSLKTARMLYPTLNIILEMNVWLLNCWKKICARLPWQTAKETNTHSSAKMFSQLISGEIWLSAEVANYLTFTWQEVITSQKPWNSKFR